MQNFKISGKVSREARPEEIKIEKFVPTRKVIGKSKPKKIEIHQPDLIIEHDIEVPPIAGYWRTQAVRMKVGDSVFFKDEEKAMSLRYALIHIGAKVAKRYMRRDKGWRVWRLEQK
jgi:hypothetical protein